MDPEALVQCPYDKNHRVRGSRLPYHLVKCQQNNPGLARAFVSCPFNARHRLPPHQLRSHIACCPDQRPPDLPHEKGTAQSHSKGQPEVPVAQQVLPWHEDWEAEVEDLEDPPPFIFSSRLNALLLPCDRGGTRRVTESLSSAVPTSQRQGVGAMGDPTGQARP